MLTFKPCYLPRRSDHLLADHQFGGNDDRTERVMLRRRRQDLRPGGRGISQPVSEGLNDATDRQTRGKVGPIE